MQQKTRPFEPGFLTKEETETNRQEDGCKYSNKINYRTDYLESLFLWISFESFS
jgi:hypothetical protein